VMDTTGSMDQYIEHCKAQLLGLLQQLAEGAGMPVACSFVSYKDFGNQGHLEVHPWSDMNNARQVDDLRQFIARLSSSGGDDTEEDIAGGFEKALELMMERRTTASMKLVLLVADCGAHGYPHGRPNYQGVNQKERLRKAVQKLVAKDKLGCELMLARITGHTDLTCNAIDSWLQEHRTFIEQIEMGHVSAEVFRHKILAALRQVVAFAVAPPSAKGLDVYSGTDFSVCDSLMNSRLANYASRLADKVSDEETAEFSMEVGEEDDDELVTEDKRPTAFESLVRKLNSDDYAMVREAMAAISEGVLKEYVAPSGQQLSKASMDALLQAGLTVQDLIEAGYPEHIIDVFRQGIKDRLTL
jgi:hypothetical protein